MIPDVLKDFVAHVEGEGYAGRVTEAELPKLKTLTEDHRGGGMDAPVSLDMGQEKLAGSLTFAGSEGNILRQWGKTAVDATRITLRGSYEGSGTSQAVKVEMTGRFVEADLGTLKPGEKAPQKYAYELVYFKYDIDGTNIVEIDVLNIKRIINGVDQLTPRRAALGL